jgi:class 3 adenylate cyclase
MGPVVNLAARLCAAAEHDQILVSEPVYTAVTEQLTLTSLGERLFKGFQNPLRLFALTG